MTSKRPPGRPADILAAALLLALAFLLPGLGRPAFDALFLFLVAALILNLALSVRRRRLIRLDAWEKTGPGPAEISCLLDWEVLAPGLDEAAAAPLISLFKPLSLEAAQSRPLIDQALAGLKKTLRRRPGHAGAWAYRGFCLGLRGRILGRETHAEILPEYPNLKWGGLSRRAYGQAAALEPEEASIQAEWGRSLEALAQSLEILAEAAAARSARLSALEKFENALTLDPEFFPAWHGRGRLLSREALLAERPETARELLLQAVDAYETARRGPHPDGAFYEEFGRTVFSLAQLSDNKAGDRYCRYAARLFILADEKQSGGDPAALFSAGWALAQAAALNEKTRPPAARPLYQEALDLFREAARRNPGDPDSRREAARCLSGLFQLTPAAERPAGRGPAYGFLEEAAVWAGQAAELDSRKFSDWADILSSLAEYGPEERRAGLWAKTARLYGRAARRPGLPPARAAVNWHNWGYALAAQAAAGPAARRRRLLRLALGKYERAAGLNGDDLITLENWGDALAELANLTEDPAAAGRRRGAAVAKYRQAIKLYPDQAGPWRRWSAFNQALALAERNPARRRELWRAAAAKLETAAETDPADAATWAFWGRLLMDIFEESPEYERPFLAAAMIEKFEKALELDREDDETWSRLGRARLEAAELAEEFHFNGGRLNNAVQASRHFQTACALNPAEAGYWAEWGKALFKVSQLADNEASSLAALKEAYEKYLTASALNPAEGEHHADLGHVLYQWGWRLEDSQVKAERFKKAYERFGEAGRLAPHDPSVWRNWAKVTEALASLEDDPDKSSAWQSEAEEKYYRAEVLESPDRLRRH